MNPPHVSSSLGPHLGRTDPQTPGATEFRGGKSEQIFQECGVHTVHTQKIQNATVQLQKNSFWTMQFGSNTQD